MFRTQLILERKKTGLTILLFLFCFLAHGQSKKEIREDIALKYNATIRLIEANKFDSQEVKYDCPDYPESGSIIFYGDSNNLRMIEHSYVQGDHSGQTDQYLVWEDQVLFIFSEYSDWTWDSVDSLGTMHTIDNIYEQRYYFHNGEPILCLYKNFEIRSASDNNPTSQDIPNKEVECFKENIPQLDRFEKLLRLANQEVEPDSCIWEY